MIETLLIGLATFALVTASPGPAILTVVQTALSHGLGRALSLALGLSLGLGLWGVLAAAGFGALLAAAPSVLVALKLAGGAYLLWLAWGSARSATRDGATPLTGTSGFRAGLLLNLSNPKAVFAWTATLAVGTPAGAPHLAWALVPLATLLAVAINAGYALIFSRPALRRSYAHVRRWIDGVAAGLFAVAGAALIRDGVLQLARRP